MSAYRKRLVDAVIDTVLTLGILGCVFYIGFSYGQAGGYAEGWGRGWNDRGKAERAQAPSGVDVKGEGEPFDHCRIFTTKRRGDA